MNNNFYNLRSRKIYLKDDIEQKKEKDNKNLDEIKFIDKTLNPNIFDIEDVLGDNACFYRCISNILYYYSGETNIKKIFEFNWDKKTYDSFGYSSEKQELMSRKLQKKIAKWLFKNRNNKMEKLGITIKEFVINTHDMFDEYDCEDYDGDIYEALMIEYLSRYSKFAGDEYSDEYDRWGGAPEQYAISEIFNVPVYVYVYKKFNNKMSRIENGKIRNNKPEKGVRLELYQAFGEKYLNNNNGIHILYKNTKRCKGHYMCLYKKK